MFYPKIKNIRYWWCETIIMNYTLRFIEEKDLPLILEWRNSEKIHSKMLTDHKITWEEHYRWYHCMKEQLIKRNFLFEYNKKPIGYIGYTEFDEKKHTCSPGAYLGESIIAPKDAALCLFYTSIEYAFTELNMLKLNTDVFADNKRALKLDKFLGYEILTSENRFITKNGQEKLTYRLVLDKEKWLIHKKTIQSYLSI